MQSRKMEDGAKNMSLEEDLKGKYYKFEEQIKVYNSHKSKLSEKDKYKLIDDFLFSSDFWGYFELITTVTYELADNTDKYLELLEKINNKIKRDMAQGPFLNILKDIGKNKPFALQFYKKIITKSKDSDFKVVAGLILGGYSVKNDSILEEFLNKKLEYPQTNSILKAILYKYESQRLSKEAYSYFDKISKNQDKKILQEFINVCLIFFNKNKDYFYNKLFDLIKLKDKNITYLLFDRLTYKDLLNQKQIFELIKYSKDMDYIIIDKIVEVLRKFPQPYKQISDLFIYWLNKDMEFKLRHFDWALEELVKKNRLFIRYILENYKRIQNKKSKLYIVTLPHLFKTLSKFHISYALDQILKFNLKNKDEKYLFFELNNVLIGNIFKDIKNKDVIIKLIDNLIKISKEKNFIEFNKNKYNERKNKKPFSKDDYDYLINFAENLLTQLRNRKEKYNFDIIKKNLKKYTNLYKFAKEVIIEAENKKRYTPLIWLGENEQPTLEDIKISEKDSELNKAFKIDFVRSRFWPKAYLYELNKNIKIIETKANEKFKKKEHIVKDIKQNLFNENKFWNYFSELIFINKFDNNHIEVIEPLPPNKKNNNLDLKVNLFNKDIYFEITRPEINKNLRLSNSAVAMPNEALKKIKNKFKKQIKSDVTLKEMLNKKRSDIIFIVIDKSGSTIDEHEIINTFFGSLSLTLVMDKKTGKTIDQYPSRKDDSIHKTNPNTDIISGVIYFKQELTFDKKNKPFIKLKGDIIQNPKGINLLNENEIKKLKEIIFK